MSSPTRFCTKSPSLEDGPYILVLCRLHPVKGLGMLLDVFLELTEREEFRRWQLVVAGEGKARYVTGLKRIVKKRVGEDRVFFTGWLDGAAKAAVLQKAKLLALPSLQENFGISVVEALACGVPVLVSEHVNLAPEIRKAGAGWVVNLERAAFLRILKEALRNEDERISRGSAGRDFVASRFTWPTIADEMEKFYQSLM